MPIALSVALALACVPAAGIAYGAESDPVSIGGSSSGSGEGIDPAVDGAAGSTDPTDPADIAEQDRPIASGTAQRSFVVATTLKNTAVPIVKATLPLMSTTTDQGFVQPGISEEGRADSDDPRAGGSQVRGSLVHDGMIFAMTADDEMALVAIDAAKLDGAATAERMLALPMKLAPSKTEAYRLTSIASRVFGDVRTPREQRTTVDPASEAGSAPRDTSEAEALDEGDDDPHVFAPVIEDDGIIDATSTGEATTDEGLIAEKSLMCLGIPATVRDIAADAFENYESLEYLVVAEDNETYSSYDGALCDAARTSLLLVPEGRRGAVRIPDTVVKVNDEMFSHRDDLALIVDAGSTAITSEDGFLHDKDLTTFDFPVPIALVDQNIVVAATPNFSEATMGDGTSYDEAQWVEALANAPDTIELQAEESEASDDDRIATESFERTNTVVPLEVASTIEPTDAGPDGSPSDEAGAPQDLGLDTEQLDRSSSLMNALDHPEDGMQTNENIAYVDEGYVLATPQSATYVENDRGTLQYRASFSFARSTNVYVKGDIPTTDGGQNAHWQLENGELRIWCDKDADGNSYVISGDFLVDAADVPWASVRALVEQVRMDKDLRAESLYFWFAYMTNLKDANGIFIPEGCTDTRAMFYYCSNLVKLPSDLELPASVENVYVMFEGCSSLTAIPAGFTAERVTVSIRCLFKYCTSLVALPTGFKLPATMPWDSTIPYEHVFYRCDALTTFPDGFDLPSLPAGHGYGATMMLCAAPTPTYCVSPGANLAAYFATFGGTDASSCKRTLSSDVPAGYSKVDFIANDAVIMTQLVGADRMIHDPADPGIAGHRFGGWYTSTDFVTVYDFSRPYDEQASEYPYAGRLYALLLDEDGLSYSGDLPTTDGNMNAHWSFEDGVLSLWCDTDPEGNSYVISDEGAAYGEREAPWSPIRALVTSIHMDPALRTETMSLWFNGMANLVDASGTFIPEGCSDASGIFKGCARLTTLPADLTVPANVETVYTLFEGCFALKTVPQNFSVEHVNDIRCLFKHCTSLVSLPERFRLPSFIEWDGTGHVPYEHVFYNCYSLASLPAGFDLPSIPSGQTYSRDMMLCITPTVTYCSDPGPNLVRYFADFGGEGSTKCNRTLSTTVPSGYSSVTFMYGDEVLSTQLVGSDGMIVDPGDPRIGNLSFAGWFTDTGHYSPYNFSLPWNAQAVLTPFSGKLYALLIDATTLVTEGDLPTTDGAQNAHWRFDDGTLSIWCDKGPDGNSCVISPGICTGEDGPWYALRTLVTDIRMDPGVKAENVDFWFAGMTGLVRLGSGTVFVPDGCVTSEAMFKNCTSLETLPADFFLPVGIESVYTMFEGCSALRTVPAGFTAEHVTKSVRCLFKFCISLSTLPEGFRLPARLGFETVSSGIPYEHVFYRCDSLVSFPPGFDIPSIPSGNAYSREMMMVPKATLTYCSSPGPNFVKYFDDFGGEGSTKCGRTLMTTIPSGYTKVDFVRIGDTPEEDSIIASQMIGSDNMVYDPGDPGILGTTFAGWFIDRFCRISYDFSAPFDRQSSVEPFSGRLYAQLLPSHTITWNANGGTWSAEAWDSFDRLTTVSHGGVPVQPIEPQRIGYDFIGWNVDPGATSESVIGAREDATYYALWKERSYTITYMANKGGSLVNVLVPKTVKFETESFLLPNSAAATRTGFGLVGWTIEEDLDDLWASAMLPTDGVGPCDTTATVKALFAGGEPPSSSFDLYTLWRHDRYDIVYDLDGGVWEDEEGPTDYQYGLPEADEAGTVTIPRPMRARWIFSGWKAERIDASGNPLADTSGFGVDEGIGVPDGTPEGNTYRLTPTTRGHWKLTAIWQPVVSIDLPIEGVYDDENPHDANEITIHLDTNTGLSGTAQGTEAARVTSFEIRSTTPVSTTLSIASRAESDDHLLSLLSGSKTQEFIDSMRFSMAFVGGVSELDGVDVDETGNKTVVRILDRKNDALSPIERLHVVPCSTTPIYVRGALDLLANTDLIRSGDVSIRRTDEKGPLAELVWTVDASEWHEENLPDILSSTAV